MFRWEAMSALWSWAAFVSFAFTVSGEQPALERSLLTSVNMRAAAPDAGAAGSGVLVDAAGFGALAGAAVFGAPQCAVRCAVWVRDASAAGFSWGAKQAMAAEGTPTAPTATTATVIFR
ncbi:hypothetical protein GCM10010207_27450 [Streptomyces atratus]|nr:hypothetical protein GCM10010207_27450 [Streptomyces atratus]